MNMNFIYIILTIIFFIYIKYEFSNNNKNMLKCLNKKDLKKYSKYNDFISNVFLGVDDQETILKGVKINSIHSSIFRK